MNTYNCKDIYKYYKLNGGKLSYELFKKIVALNNKKNADLIMNMGYEYNIPYLRCVLRILVSKRHIKINDAGNISGAINWGESNKLKEKIIQEGKVPFQTYYEPDGLTIKGDNGGEKWLVYFTDDKYYSWNCFIHTIGGLHNMTKYKFQASWTNARTLITLITPDSEFIYSRENKGNNATSRSDLVKIFATENREDVWTGQQQLAR